MRLRVVPAAAAAAERSGHERWLAKNEGGWIDRSNGSVAPLGAGLPLIIAVVAGIGYFYTALHLSWKLLYSAYLLAGILILDDIMVRWLVLARRRLAIEKAQKRQEAEQRAQQGKKESAEAQQSP